MRITLITGLIIQALLIVICLLKGKYRAALISCFVPFVAWFARFGWPGRTPGGRKSLPRQEGRPGPIRRAAKFDQRWDPKARWLSDLIAGAPSQPDPPDILAAKQGAALRTHEQETLDSH